MGAGRGRTEADLHEGRHFVAEAGDGRAEIFLAVVPPLAAVFVAAGFFWRARRTGAFRWGRLGGWAFCGWTCSLGAGAAFWFRRELGAGRFL